ncbi:unnamed protein product [Spirodela intermedia]|uniref:DNA-(apurinic or apyrimidinic site) endonuclease 2 n=1 Tax=Spirodela intermedia TaxID=51605 RepID=A0A7I8L2P7_SPIIN|nr:unnamed protein product [Spirodela intermedia]
MKIVTYNVNGLRQRVAQHGSLLRLLNALDADIICLQETKLSRQDLSADLTMPQGYEAFVSCTRTTEKGRTCYSGVATFCRVTSAFYSKEVTLPLAAEEGITGLLGQSGKRENMTMDFSLEGLEDVKNEDLFKVDSEGRCIITDHGHFVLINIYGPRADDNDKERVHFKHLFFKILQRRWESLLSHGRRVCVVGDFNIAPAAIDCCDARLGFEENPFRKWLKSLLRESGGAFFDVFRAKHPKREGAYTCWPQNVGGEEFNYGTRIDHIFIAGPCLHQNYDGEEHSFFGCHVRECDILVQFKRGKDNMSRWNGGRCVKLEGSDHAPVYVSLADLPDLPIHNTPTLAARYVPEVRGWQQTIVPLLLKSQVPIDFNKQEINASSTENIAGRDGSEAAELSQNCMVSEHESESSMVQCHFQSVRQHIGGSVDETGKSMIAVRAGKGKLGTGTTMIGKKKERSKHSQRTIRSFFQRCESISSVRVEDSGSDVLHSHVHVSDQKGQLSALLKGLDSSCTAPEEADNGRGSASNELDEVSVAISDSLEHEKNNNALLEWQRIQQRMQTSLPLCRGHNEPCVARFVKKSGPNIGRGFYVCARAKGPSSNPEANCGYFKWASGKVRQKKT